MNNQFSNIVRSAAFANLLLGVNITHSSESSNGKEIAKNDINEIIVAFDNHFDDDAANLGCGNIACSNLDRESGPEAYRDNSEEDKKRNNNNTTKKTSLIGRTVLKERTIKKELTTFGRTIIDSSNFMEKVKILGKTNISKSIFWGRVKITGNSSLEDTTFKENVKIIGNLNIKQSLFEKNIKIIARHIRSDGMNINGKLEAITPLLTLINSSVNDVFINTKRTDEAPKLYLKGTTRVKGDIIFIGKPGIIYKDAMSIIEGKIKGGNILEQ